MVVSQRGNWTASKVNKYAMSLKYLKVIFLVGLEGDTPAFVRVQSVLLR
jgi:hypothetical protein